ncbi:Xanthine/uracil permease [Morchella conica CCBAS932]|uniref:Xanthine/uracil permease n=1 Tax=Morchella conica CCBAS932 TaxID=1392247 RepID=A0A3N4KFR8_9PEZI|nr:Xanthine/uracil permease [Morchella conica CCBAS932]
MSTSVSNDIDTKPDEKTVGSSAIESYDPTLSNPHSEGSWLQRAKAEILFLCTTKEGLIGRYDYVWLLTPDIPPFNRKYKDRVQPFYGINDRIPLLLTILLGVQHSLAMMGGIVVPPIILVGASGVNLDTETVGYLVSTALILSGVFSLFQIVRFKIFNTGFWIGTGMMCVVGEAFSVIPIAQTYFAQQYASGYCEIGEDGRRLPCPDAYGRLIGTISVVMCFQIAISLVKPRVLMKMCPNLVVGMVMVCIGSGLVASGAKSWAGGSGPCMNRPESGFFQLCPNIAAPQPRLWGSPSFIGLGFSVYITILIVELFGAPLIRNCSVACGLLVGAVIAAATGFVDSAPINRAPSVTFMWTHTFKLGIDGSLVLPLIACCITTSISCLGDIMATAEVSGIDVETEGNPDLDVRIQGGLTADALWSVLAGLATSTPTVCFAQNNGVIALSGCASRRAGYAACFILFLAGVCSKFGAAITVLPPSVIGGMTTFLFTSVIVSGLRILSTVRWNRRNRFIATAALTLGFSDLIVPNWIIFLIPETESKALNSFYDGLNLIISTGYVIVAFVGCSLNAILPDEKSGSAGAGYKKELPLTESLTKAD